MKKKQYTKAPVSEVILGITYSEPVFGKNGIIFDVISNEKNNYPIIEHLPPVGDEILDGYLLNRIQALL